MSAALLIEIDGSHRTVQIRCLNDIIAAVGQPDFTGPAPVGHAIHYACYEYSLFEQQVNPVATELYRETHPLIAGSKNVDHLAGKILVLGPPDACGDETDVPRQIVRRVGEIVSELGQEEIDRRARALTESEMDVLHTRNMEVLWLAGDALKEGRPVDYGGTIIIPLRPEDGGRPSDS